MLFIPGHKAKCKVNLLTSTNLYPTVIRFNVNGAVVWQKQFYNVNCRVLSVDQAENGYRFLTSLGDVIKLDNNGNIIEQKNYHYNLSLYSLIRTQEGGFIIKSSESIDKMDSKGNFLWGRGMGGPRIGMSNLYSTKDSGYIVALSDSEDNDIKFVKFDTNGALPANCNIFPNRVSPVITSTFRSQTDSFMQFQENTNNITTKSIYLYSTNGNLTVVSHCP